LRIIIYGAYGAGNFGDEATLDALIERFKNIMPEAEILVFSSDPRETRKLYRVQACRPSLMALIKTDILIIEDLDTLFKLLAGFLARMLKKKVVYYAVGAPNLSLPMKLMIPLAMNTRKVYTRDLYSKETLKRYGVRCAISVIPDPALQLIPLEKCKALQILEKEGVTTDRFLVGLSLRYSRSEELNDRVKNIIVYIADWLIKDKNAEIVFIPMCKHKYAKIDKDDLFGEELRQLVNQKEHFKILKGLSSPREVKGIFSLMNICIGMRLHSAVFAYSVGVPYIGLVTGWTGYDEKIISFMKSFCRQNPININKIDIQFLKYKIVEMIDRNFSVN
jgi:polysaccharide pyruvyl transferase WcaK-like protein